MVPRSFNENNGFFAAISDPKTTSNIRGLEAATCKDEESEQLTYILALSEHI